MIKKSIKNYDIRVLLKETLIKDVMSKPVITVKQSDNFSKVEEKFLKHKIRHLPVLDETRKLVGLITKRDLFRTVSPRKAVEGQMEYSQDKIIERGGAYYSKELLDSFILKNVMVRRVYSLREAQSIAVAVGIMVKKKVGCVPITDGENKIKGIITRFDVLKMAYQLAVGKL